MGLLTFFQELEIMTNGYQMGLFYFPEAKTERRKGIYRK
jgi:hypothetical protein